MTKEKASTRSRQEDKTAKRGVNEPSVPATRVSAEMSNTAVGPRSAGPHTATVSLPFVTATFRAPRITAPHITVAQLRVPEAMDPRRLVSRAGEAASAIRSALPPPTQLAYYSGLGALAISGIVEWPVALAIGAGTVIAQQRIGARRPVSSAAGTRT